MVSGPYSLQTHIAGNNKTPESQYGKPQKQLLMPPPQAIFNRPITSPLKPLHQPASHSLPNEQPSPWSHDWMQDSSLLLVPSRSQI